jgi:hypothetical protein
VDGDEDEKLRAEPNDKLARASVATTVEMVEWARIAKCPWLGF